MTTESNTPADFSRVINPARVPAINRAGNDCNARLWIKIQLKGGRLSITGVEGPLSNGDALGSCGQCGIDPDATPAAGYTAADLAKLRDVWAAWHLNDMRPYSPAMAALGWPEQAGRAILCHEFTRDLPGIEASNAAKKAALAALERGEAFTPTPEQSAAFAAPYSLKVWAYPEDGTPETPAGYKPAQVIGGGRAKGPERKTLGWIKPGEHPDGLLGRKVAPEDSHGYGGKWWREELPADVAAWLAALPLPPEGVAPAWV